MRDASRWLSGFTMFEDDASGRSGVLRRIYRVRVGRDPAATPVHSTDVCCSRIQFSEMIPQASTHAASQFPRDTGARDSRRETHFGEPADVPERVLLRAPPCQRASDASSPGGLPWRSCVHQRRPAIASATSGRTRRPRPRWPARVNGIWLRLGPRHLRRLSVFRADRRPDLRVPSTPAPFQDGSRAGDEESFLPCHRPSGDSPAPYPRALPPRALRRAAARAV